MKQCYNCGFFKYDKTFASDRYLIYKLEPKARVRISDTDRMRMFYLVHKLARVGYMQGQEWLPIDNWEAVLRFNRDKLELHLDCMQAHVRTWFLYFYCMTYVFSIFAQVNVTNPRRWLVKFDVLSCYSPTGEYIKQNRNFQNGGYPFCGSYW